MKPQDLFAESYYLHDKEDDATATKSFYTYYDKNDAKAFGISGEKRIRLNYDSYLNAHYDQYFETYCNSDPCNHHRISVISNGNGNAQKASLARCGRSTFEKYNDFKDAFSLYMYFK